MACGGVRRVVLRRVRRDVGVVRCWVPGVWRWARRCRRGGDGGCCGCGAAGEEEEEEGVRRDRMVEVRREGR